MTILKQPLLHFLLLGALLFILFEMTATSETRDNQIVVDRDSLLTFMQFRSKAFDTARFNSILDNMPEQRRQQLIEDFTREETLYREALALGLDANDYIIRQRLVQKVEYLARGFEPPSDLDVEAFYQENVDRYRVPANATFTHVFVSFDNHESRETAFEVVNSLQQTLLENDVTFSGALTYGERFAFHKNYVERTREFVASHFGNEFAQTVFNLPVGEWSGPVESAYGFHMVLISQRTEDRIAPLSEVESDVQFDAQQAAMRRQTEEAINQILNRYEVVLEL